MNSKNAYQKGTRLVMGRRLPRSLRRALWGSLAMMVVGVPAGRSNPAQAAYAVTAYGSCHQVGTGKYVLPDPSCTPGVTNPSVTQANTGSTICRRGWTRTVRPPQSYTDHLKIQQMVAYGDGAPRASYEEDHLIPLELGGSPMDPRNLWPEPGRSGNPKDKVEAAANRAVCRGSMTLDAARQAISSNWVAFGVLLGVVKLPSAPGARGPATTTTEELGPPTIPPPRTATVPPTTTTGTTGCTPLSSAGNCYKPGQLCPNADHGLSGIGAGGQRITCEDVNGWRWVAA